MSLPDQIGTYKIDRELGRGGMGVVYLGHDSSLNRPVAIKVLPEHVADDAERLARFSREARTLASLNHPNVAGIYGVEEQDGQRYLVLEFVEGESLAERLDRGPLDPAETLEIADQIAAGVEAAHDAGIIHRDLKPANIMVTPDGQAKVLDFGLARSEEASSSQPGDSLTVPADSPTVSPTTPGVILGTASYMSPEQARGRRLDKRTDIWSFGVVLYEMLVGRSPFAGETATDSLGAILHKTIHFDRLPDSAPPRIRRVLGRCLQRDKNQRYRDIGDVRLDLASSDVDDSFVAAVAASGPHEAVKGGPGRWLWPIGLLITGVAAWGLGFGLAGGGREAAAPTPDLALSIHLEDGYELEGAVAISPDGRRLAYGAADANGIRHVYIRDLDSFDARRVDRSRGGEDPAFSPDGEAICFSARSRLWRAPVSGVGTVEVGASKATGGISWGEDGRIVFSDGVGSALWVIPEEGGRPEPLTRLEDDESSYAHVWPQHVPGTNYLMFTSWVGGNNGGARLLDLDSGEIQAPGSVETNRRSFVPPARWSASGHIVLEVWDTGLLVQPFDLAASTRITAASPIPLLPNVLHLGSATRSLFALSNEGTMVYAHGIPGQRRLVWVDQNGNVTPILDSSVANEYGRLESNLQLSRDGRRALVGRGNIIEIDLRRGIARSVTGEGNDLLGVWSPDESEVYYASNVETRWSIYKIAKDSTTPELVLRRDENVYLADVSPSGQLLFGEEDPETGADVWILETDGTARALINSPSDEYPCDFSPDGRWVLCDSEATGRSEVYVLRTDGTGTPIQITTDGGSDGKWNAGGDAIYFRRGRSVCRIAFEDGEPVGEVEVAFPAPFLRKGPTYVVTPDESRLLAVQDDEISVPNELRVRTNFFAEIERVAGPGSRP